MQDAKYELIDQFADSPIHQFVGQESILPIMSLRTSETTKVISFCILNLFSVFSSLNTNDQRLTTVRTCEKHKKEYN